MRLLVCVLPALIPYFKASASEVEAVASNTADLSAPASISPIGASIGVAAYSYVDEVFPTLNGRYKGRLTGKTLEARGEVEGKLALPPATSAFYFELPEAYFGTTPDSSPVQVSVGRKLEKWNDLDERWQLGIWQPRYRWDYLRPETVGLTGVFLTVDRPLFHLVGFGSGLYVPERGVPVEASNGQLISDSPWFISPPSRVTINGRETPVRYTLAVPPINQIVEQAGVGGIARVGAKQGPWLSGAYAYKPVNQLLLAYDAKLQFRDTGKDFGDATIYPRVAHHHLFSAETGYRSDSLNLTLSSLLDFPATEALPSDWTSQQISVSRAISPSIEYRFGGEHPDSPRVGVSYLRQWGGNSPDYSPDDGTSLSEDGSTFENRYPFQSAVLVTGETKLPFQKTLGSWSRNVRASTRFLRDISHDGAILSADVKYRVRVGGAFRESTLEFSLGADVLGTNLAHSYKEPPTDFIATYRDNDRMRFGVTYVF